MDLLSALILGFVQGFTEFLPISSSGHLVLAREVFGLSFDHGLAYDAVLHLATASAVVVYFWRDWVALLHTSYRLVFDRASVSSQNQTLLVGLVLATIPVVVVGLMLEGIIERELYSITTVAWAMIACALFFVLAEWYARKKKPAELTLTRALPIGLFQVIALVPGMSRSGATIAGGLFVGLSRVDSARFSFMLSLPIVVGVGAEKLLALGISGLLEANLVSVTIGMLVSFLVGLATIHYFIRYLKHYSLMPFAVYLLLAGVFVLFMIHG